MDSLGFSRIPCLQNPYNQKYVSTHLPSIVIKSIIYKVLIIISTLIKDKKKPRIPDSMDSMAFWLRCYFLLFFRFVRF